MGVEYVRKSRTSETKAPVAPGIETHIVYANRDYGRMVKACVQRLTRRARSRLTWGDVSSAVSRRSATAPMCFISRIADIPDKLPPRVSGAKLSKYLLFAEGLPVEAIASRLPRLGIRDAERLHIAREQNPREVSSVISRLVAGISSPDGPTRIVDAWLEGNALVLLSPAFKRLTVPLAELLQRTPIHADDLGSFNIDEDGSFLHWPRPDVHLGWENLLRFVDPTASLAAKQKKEEFNRCYGAAIRAAREEAGLKQTDIAGITDRNLRRVERGQIPATKATLQALADSHGLPLDDYLKKVASFLNSTSDLPARP